MTKQANHLYEFGPFRLDPAERLLLRDGQAVQLTAKAFDTLLVLVENSGQVVKKDYLLEQVWSDTVVEESTLAQNIFTLRKTLGEDSHENRFIETVPKFGYRFVADVRELAEREEQTVVQTKAKREGARKPEASDDKKRSRAAFKPMTLLVAASVLLVGIVAALVYFWPLNKNAATTAEVRTIAVLPFKPISPADRDEYLEFGIAETLITKLSQVNQLVVRSMGSVRKYEGLEQDPIAAGRELKADYVLEGGLQKRDDRIRITARLIRVKDGQSLWADTFDENSTDVFRVQEVISEQMTRALDLKLTGDEQRRLAKRETENTEAHQLYHKGRYLWNKRTEEALKKSIEYFEQAIEKDPDYELAYSAIADSYVVLGTWGFVSPKEAFPKAKQAAQKALDRDPDLAEARAALAYAHHLFDWEQAEPEKEFKRAIEINPNYCPARQFYSVCLMSKGRLDEAIHQIRIAQETDPVALNLIAAGGWVYFLGRQYDFAIAECRKALDMNSNFFVAHKYLALIYLQKGMYEEAISEFQTAYRLSGGTPYLLAELGHAYALAGRRAEAERVLKELNELSKRRYVPPYPISLIYAGLNDADKAFEWLEKSFEERHPWLVQINVDPRLDLLRKDKRFSELASRIYPVLASAPPRPQQLN
ncbi:MAG TPA: winged helix-turn-helix domain-containing protein [Blastocatellia bacterium]|nr:winged helix-turn-helix domain-containing protein [Blastocatellia bacterium]